MKKSSSRFLLILGIARGVISKRSFVYLISLIFLLFLPLFSLATSTSQSPTTTSTQTQKNQSNSNHIPISQTPRPPSQAATFSNALNAWADQRRCLANQRIKHVRVTPAVAGACKRPILTGPTAKS
jgi:hypothetical protein